MEIENLAENLSACLKTEKQRWLLSSLKKEDNDIPLSKVRSFTDFIWFNTNFKLIL